MLIKFKYNNEPFILIHLINEIFNYPLIFILTNKGKSEFYIKILFHIVKIDLREYKFINALYILQLIISIFSTCKKEYYSKLNK